MASQSDIQAKQQQLMHVQNVPLDFETNVNGMHLDVYTLLQWKSVYLAVDRIKREGLRKMFSVAGSSRPP